MIALCKVQFMVISFFVLVAAIAWSEKAVAHTTISLLMSLGRSRSRAVHKAELVG